MFGDDLGSYDYLVAYIGTKSANGRNLTQFVIPAEVGASVSKSIPSFSSATATVKTSSTSGACCNIEIMPDTDYVVGAISGMRNKPFD